MKSIEVICAVVNASLEAILKSPLVATSPFHLTITWVGGDDSAAEGDEQNLCLVPLPTATNPFSAVNQVIRDSDADFIIFADLGTTFAADAASGINALIQKNESFAVAAFSTDSGKNKGRAKRLDLARLPLSNFAFNRDYLVTNDILFFAVDEQYTAVARETFLKRALVWPSKIVCLENPLVVGAETLPAKKNLVERGFASTHALGGLWFLPVLFKKGEEESNPCWRVKLAYPGHREYVRATFGISSDKDHKLNYLAFFISLIALLGTAVQAVLTLVITFTETQYIPIWAALGFMVLFVVAYAIAMPKTGKLMPSLISSIVVAVLSAIACIVTLLCLGTNPYLSIFGGFLVACLCIGMHYCLRPSRVTSKGN